MKSPNQCANIEDVRNEIDAIDAEIIHLLGRRFDYVKEIIKYKKPNKDAIIAKERYNKVIQIRREWAEKQGLSPDIIEEVYKKLIHYFIDEELALIKKENKQA